MTYDGTSDEAAAPWHYLIRFLRGAALVAIVVVQAILLFISVAAFYKIEALIAIFKVARITVPEVALLLVSSLSPLIIAVLIAKLVKPLRKGMVSVYD